MLHKTNPLNDGNDENSELTKYHPSQSDRMIKVF